MDIEDKNCYIERYSKRFTQYGYDPRTLGWSTDSVKNRLRFASLAGVGDLDGKTILDVGCGFADFFGFLTESGCKVNYTGLEIVPILAEEACLRHPAATIILGDILDDSQNLKADYVFASGIFNARVLTLGGNEQYIQAMLVKMFECADIAVCADFLSSNVDFQHEISYHANPERILAMASGLSRRFSLRHDYLPYEFCVYVYKDAAIERTSFVNTPPRKVK